MVDETRNADGEWHFGHCVIRTATRQLLIGGQPAAIGARAFDLLVVLVERSGRAVSKSELLDLVWPGLVVEENNLQVHVWALRKLLGPQSITTVPGQGYRFMLADPVTRAAPPSATPATAEARKLPVLLGREADLVALSALLRSHALVSVVGPGGVGKTVLVRAVTDGLQPDLYDGICTVDLARFTDGAQLVPAIAGVLQVTLGADATVAALAAKLDRRRRLLLVLDNCEHLLLPAAALTAALVQAAPQLRLLATSQEALKLQVEQVYRLAPLALPATPPPGARLALDQARSAGALALFEDRARAVDPHFALTDATVDAAVDVCRQLGGMPLAIELAAARVPLLGVEGLRLRLGEPLRLLTGGARDLLPRHRSLRAAIEWSHGLLTPVQQAVFRRLGVMSGSFGLAAAQQVAADEAIDEWAVLDALGALVEKSLVTVEPAAAGDDSRLRMLETLRHYALERLADQGEHAATLERHLTFYLTLAEAAREPLAGPQQGQWLARLDLDRDNLRAALKACDLLPRGAERSMRIVNSLMRYSLNRGFLYAGQLAMLEALARPGAEQHGALCAETLLHAGWFNAYRGLDREAAELLTRSVALGRACGADSLVAEALSRLGYSHIGLGDRVAARVHIEEACALAARQPDNERLQRVVLANLAELERLEGRPDAAEPLYLASLQHARNTGDRLAMMIALNNLGMVAVAAGAAPLARQRLLESLAICDEIGSRRGRLVVMEVCAGLAALLQQWERTAAFDAAAHIHTVQMGRRRDVVDAAFVAPRVAAAHEQLGDEAFAAARVVGEAMAYDAAVEDMLRWLKGGSPPESLHPARPAIEPAATVLS